MTLDDPQTYIPFFSRDAMLARYILCDGPVLVRPCVLLGAEGPRDATHAEAPRREVVVHVAYCYRRSAVARSDSVRGLLLLGLWSNTRVATYRLCLAFLVDICCLVV